LKSALEGVTTTCIGFTFGTVQSNNPIFRINRKNRHDNHNIERHAEIIRSLPFAASAVNTGGNIIIISIMHSE
jgi:hypothetical protein